MGDAKAQGKEALTKENFNLIKNRLIKENNKLDQILHSKEKIDITKLQRHIELRHKSTKTLYAMLKSENNQAIRKELDSSLLARRSMLVELIQLSIYARQTAEILYKKVLSDQMCKTKEEVEEHDILKPEQA